MIDLYALEVHELAARYPMHSTEELNSLADGIKKVGQLDPILIWNRSNSNTEEEYVIVDGRNRVEACKLAGIEPKYEIILGVSDDSLIREMILQKNGERRSQTKGQKAILRAIAFPNSGQGKRSDLDDVTSVESTEVGEVYLKKARYILKHNPDAEEGIISGNIKFDPAYDTATDNKVAKEKTRKKLLEDKRKYEQAKETAPELVAQVDDGLIEPSEVIEQIDKLEEENQKVRNSVYTIFKDFDLVVSSLVNEREFNIVMEAIKHPACEIMLEQRSIDLLKVIYDSLNKGE